MGTRHERVVLTLEDSNLSSGFARATGHAVAFKKSLADLNGTSVSSANSLRVVERQVDSLGVATRRSGADLDSYSGRLGLLTTTALALGPAILPVVAAGVPALGSLTAGMAAASVGAVALMLAFNGIGEAVTAVADYKLEPTAENFERLRATLEDFGPAGTDFVMRLDELRPALEDLQKLSRQGIFPGATTGLDAVASKLPGIRNLIADVSGTVGRLTAAAGTSLTSDSDWEEFFDFLGDNAANDLESFGRSVGNLVAGTASIVEAIGSLDGANGGLLDSSRAFREWADGIEQTEGWREFADYIQQSGPQVADLLSATADAVFALAEAAAPWASVVVPVLTAGAEAFAAIAGSPIGPPLFIAAAAMLAVSKASTLLGSGLSRVSGGIGTFSANANRLKTDVGAMSREFGNLGRARSTALSFFSGTSAAAQRTRASIAEAGKAAAAAGPGIVAVAALSTGAADKVGLTNTAMLTLAGSMAGPWGAAAGATVGLLLDVAHANDDVLASIQRVDQQAASGGGLTGMSKQLEKARRDLKTFRAEMGQGTAKENLAASQDDFWGIGGFMAGLDKIKGVFGDTGVEEAEKEFTKAQMSVKDTETAVRALADAFDVPITGDSEQQLAKLDGVLTQAGPAMDALGISVSDLERAAAQGDGSLGTMVARLITWQTTADSVAGRTDAVGEAIAALGQDAIGTAASAAQLSSALEALLSPGQDLIAAQDSMSSTLNGLKDQVDGTNKSLEGTSDAAIKNRAAISDGVSAITALTTAQSAAGASSLEVAMTMDEQRAALIQQAEAAGLSRQQTEALINQMGLTPDVIRTAFEAAGIDNVDAKTQALLHRYNALPPKVQTDIATNGIPKSEADITRLKHKYDLTPAEVRTLARLKDSASPAIAAVIRALRAADGQNATTTITTRRITEIQTISIGQQTRTDRRIEPDANGGFHVNGVKAFAAGGYGENGKYYSRTPQIIPGGANILWGERSTGWEAYISGKPGEEKRNLEILELAATRLGARVTPFATGGTTGRGRPRNSWEDGPVYTALWQASRRTPDASLIAGMTVKQLTRLGKAFDNISIKSLSRFERGLERAIDVQEKQTERARDRFEAVRDRRSEIGSSIATGLRSDLWADTGGSAFSKSFGSGSIGGATSLLKADSAKAKQFNKDIELLRKKGLNGAALQEIIGSGDADRARMFASGTRSQLQSYESAYNARQSATAAAGRLGGQVLTPEFNALRAELNQQLREAKAMNKQLSLLRKEQDRRHDAAQKSRKDNGAGPAARRGARG